MKECVSSDRCLVVMGELSGIKKELVLCIFFVANVESERRQL